MQSVINDFEALKTSDIPSPSVTTSITIPPLAARSSLSTSMNLSPSSSSSSSSYTNSSKASGSSVVSSNVSADSSKTIKSIDSGRSSQMSYDLTPLTIVDSNQRKSRLQDKGINRRFSFGKKVKRFFSLNSSKESDDEEGSVIKKINKKKEVKTLC